MKITNVSKGKAYHLSPNTKLQVERTNLFFNEYGEQTNPVSLPDTDNNRELLDYPDMMSKKRKPSASISATIEDAGYFMPCRQAVLSARRKESIETSFYMNEGSFLSKISDTSLSEIFGSETIPGLSTVEQCIDFCRSLIGGNHPEYAIFPVLVESGRASSGSTPQFDYINRYGFMVDGTFYDSLNTPLSGTPDFYNAVPRTEQDGDTTINLAAGYYMSPFIRGNYLLKRILAHFGYALNDNFFTRTTPFPDMVFINNCADALITGTIRITDLLPDCSCSTILDVYRKKFCCEFVPNEVEHTVDIILFNEVLDLPPQADLGKYLASPVNIDYPEAYKQLILSSEEQVSSPLGIETLDSIADLFAKYKQVLIDPLDGSFCRKGYFFWVLFDNLTVLEIHQKVSESSMRYYAGGNLETHEISVPDCQPVMLYNNLNITEDAFPYIGAANFLNSKLVSNNTAEAEPSSDGGSSSDVRLKPMLAFSYTDSDYPRGTVSNYKRSLEPSSSEPYIRLWDYTLTYNGSDGIFEKFYRRLDDIYRNSMHSITADLLLPVHLKQSLSPYLPVSLNGENLLLNVLKYNLGGGLQPLETSFYTYRLHEPVSSAKPFADYNTVTGYVWQVKQTKTTLTEEQYNSSPYKDKQFVVAFLPPATKEDAESGERRFVQRSAISFQFGDSTLYNEFQVWFVAVKETAV